MKISKSRLNKLIQEETQNVLLLNEYRDNTDVLYRELCNSFGSERKMLRETRKFTDEDKAELMYLLYESGLNLTFTNAYFRQHLILEKIEQSPNSEILNEELQQEIGLFKTGAQKGYQGLKYLGGKLFGKGADDAVKAVSKTADDAVDATTKAVSTGPNRAQQALAKIKSVNNAPNIAKFADEVADAQKLGTPMSIIAKNAPEGLEAAIKAGTITLPKSLLKHMDEPIKKAAGFVDDIAKTTTKTVAKGADDVVKTVAKGADDAVGAAAKTVAKGADDAVGAAAKAADPKTLLSRTKDKLSAIKSKLFSRGGDDVSKALGDNAGLQRIGAEVFGDAIQAGGPQAAAQIAKDPSRLAKIGGFLNKSFNPFAKGLTKGQRAEAFFNSATTGYMIYQEYLIGQLEEALANGEEQTAQAIAAALESVQPPIDPSAEGELIDTDGDGIPDAQAAPAASGGIDTDGDGIPDMSDPGAATPAQAAAATAAVSSQGGRVGGRAARQKKLIRQGFMGTTNPKAAMKEIQELLSALGYAPAMPKTFKSGKPDGKYGSETMKAIKAFQKSVGIKRDGLVGPVTYGKMADVLQGKLQVRGRVKPQRASSPKVPTAESREHILTGLLKENLSAWATGKSLKG